MKTSVRTALQIASCIALIAWVIGLFPRKANSFQYPFEQGQPWGYGLITAPYDFPIYKSDEQLALEQKQVLQSFAPCFKLLPDARQTQYYIISFHQMQRLTQMACTHIAVVHNRQSQPVPLSRVYTPRSIYQLTHRELPINLTYDSITSEQLKSSLISDISLTEGVVRKGEKIIDTGEMVTPATYRILDSLRRSEREKNVSAKQLITSTVGTGVTIAILLFLFFLYLFIFRPYLLRELNNTLFFVILMGIIISAAFLMIRYAPTNWIYLIPFVWMPIITRVFYDSRTALFVHIITVLIVSVAVSTPYIFIVLQITVGMVTVSNMRDMTQRAQLAGTALFAFLTYSVVYTALILSMTGRFSEINPYFYGWFAINAVLLICSYGVIYLFEKAFNLVSNITLVELTNVNSKLMLEFARKAPGTFQHSLQVSHLATEAAKSIGAKVLLVRTGALYHDIGKALHAQYFSENQQQGRNPLLKMSPQEAAKVVITHTQDGIELARKHHLPDVIFRFILSHHGTSVVRYFYNTALNEQSQLPPEQQQTISINDFRYPGPKPSTKEEAILMMADAIEARSKSMNVINEQSIAQMVDTMIDQQVSDGQFSNTPLSFKDLERIRSVFKQKLLEINHHRISYPELNIGL